jgi:hypothetical protein
MKVCYICNMNELKNILEQLRQTKTLVIIILLIVFILFYYKSLITNVVERKIDNTDEVKEDINNNVLIQQMLNELMLRYKADRAYVFQFHNTIRYYDGSHRNHQSMTFEVCANGISSEANGLQNLAVSLYPVFLQEVMLERMQYKNISKIKEESTRINLKKQGIKSIFTAPYFKDGKFVAYLGLDFVKEEMQNDFNYNEFKSFTDEIGNILVQ